MAMIPTFLTNILCLDCPYKIPLSGFQFLVCFSVAVSLEAFGWLSKVLGTDLILIKLHFLLYITILI
jgi:hypothetical protein